MQDIQNVLNFWFLPENHIDHGKTRIEWFKKDPDFDHAIKKQFLDTYKKAKNGELLKWTENKEGCLALILLFDQFSRNMFRESPDAFASDGKAREIVRFMLVSGFFEQIKNFQKTFAALPFEHSEDLQDQKTSLKMFRDFGTKNEILYAEQHFEIIKNFGRFPHRNGVLGRVSTDKEIAFLKQPNSSF